MTKYAANPTKVERTFGEKEIIVSKTDLKGKITYANEVFQRVGLYNEEELLGQPHSILRHPDMPRCVFKLLWDTISNGQEIFAYVKNMAKNGDFYWVLAHVTPSYDAGGRITGYHSNRRSPRRDAIAKIEPVYRQLVAVENRDPSAREGMTESFNTLVGMLEEQGMDYGEFVFSL